MFNFSKHELKTSTFTFDTLDGKPTVQCRFAGEYNKPYFSKFIAGSEVAKSARKGGKIKVSARVFEQTRDLDKKLYPESVVFGFVEGEEPIDTGGGRVPYTTENCRDFLAALPDYMFDELRTYCSDLDNFGSDYIEDPEELGNS